MIMLNPDVVVKERVIIRRGGRAELSQLLGVEFVGTQHFLPEKIESALDSLSRPIRELLYLRFGVIDGIPASIICTARRLRIRQNQLMGLEELAINALKGVLNGSLRPVRRQRHYERRTSVCLMI